MAHLGKGKQGFSHDRKQVRQALSLLGDLV
jgi:hypothetical protein